MAPHLELNISIAHTHQCRERSVPLLTYNDTLSILRSDPAMEEALYETTILRQFAGLSLERIPDETTILNFRRLLEKHELAVGTLEVING